MRSDTLVKTKAGRGGDIYMYNFIKKHVAASGELMVKVSDGQKFELHIHNTKFDDKEKMIVLDAGAETYWINPDQIVYMWIHRVKE